MNMVADGGGSAMALLPVARQELRRHPVLYVGLFTAIALIALAVGILLPKKYSSTTTILVEESNIIAPLMEGRAVATGVANRASIAREVAFSRKVMQQVLQAGGWAQTSALAKDKLSEQITDRTQITNPRENLIQINYTDSDPTRAFHVTRRFAEMVISESLATKERESREAYGFIDSQVTQYHRKLTEAEAKLEAYRTSNPDARPGIDTDVNARIGELRRQVETSRLDLIDLRSEEGALDAQLSGESEVSSVQTRAGQIRARLAELMAQRETLLLTYTEQHPDVVRVEHQVRDLEDDLNRETTRQATRLASSDTKTSSDGSTAMNPLYGELRSKLSEARSRSAAVSSRINTGETLLAQELDRSKRIAASESSLAELTRDYEVNRDLYQDLLKRRENARVSMNLDAEHRGLSFRIQEPAAMPLRPSGVRLLHVAGAGLGAAMLAPFMLLFGVIKLDPRVRAPLRIEREASLPVLGTMPLYVTPARRKEALRRYALAALVFALVPVTFALAITMKLVHSA